MVAGFFAAKRQASTRDATVAGLAGSGDSLFGTQNAMNTAQSHFHAFLVVSGTSATARDLTPGSPDTGTVKASRTINRSVKSRTSPTPKHVSVQRRRI